MSNPSTNFYKIKCIIKSLEIKICKLAILKINNNFTVMTALVSVRKLKSPNKKNGAHPKS